jgi:hypothetical protein
MIFWHWLLHVLGVDNVSGPWYAFWSGFGSDITEFTILGAVFATYKHHTCHVDRCWRIGKHKLTKDGVEYVLCRKHHPHTPGKVTAAHMGERE